MYYGKISKEIGSVLSMYNQSQFGFFKDMYSKELEKQLEELNKAREKFYGYAVSHSDYQMMVNRYITDRNFNDKATSNFYRERDQFLNKIMNDKENTIAKNLWTQMEKAESLIFNIRDKIYGGVSETKYHIGIQVGDNVSGQLRSFELDPKQMLKLQSNKEIFKADIKSRNIRGGSVKDFDFTLRFTTHENLTANQLISGIEQAGGINYHNTSISNFLDVYTGVQQDLLRIQSEQIQIKMNDLTDQINNLTNERSILNRRSDESKNITKQLTPLRNQLRKLEKKPETTLNFGFGRGFEAYERMLYGLDYLPSQNSSLTYDDNASWIMQQDLNIYGFRGQAEQAKLTMIQNKFFKEQSRFSTISMSSLFSGLKSFQQYFTMPEDQYTEFYELSKKDRKRLDDEVYYAASQAAKESLVSEKGAYDDL